VIYSLKASFVIQNFAFLLSFFSTASCSILAVRNENGGSSSSSVGPYNYKCQVKIVTDYRYLDKETQRRYEGREREWCSHQMRGKSEILK